MTTHTPGPWSIQSFPGNEPQAVIVSASQMVANTLHKNDEANARLIAAAPELLEALDDMRKWVAAFAYGKGANAHAEVMKSERMQKAMSAIAKATGETE